MNIIKGKDYTIQLDNTGTILVKVYQISIDTFVIPQYVTTIGRYSFANLFSLTKIMIPKTVELIQEGAFCECLQLSSIVFEERSSPICIHDKAFWKCKLLKSIDLPIQLTSLRNSVFEDCISLDHIFIPATLNNISPSCFRNARNLRRIDVDVQNDTYASLNGILITEDSLIRVPCGFNCQNDDEEMVLSLKFLLNSVTNISEEAFQGTNIKKMILHSNIERIEQFAFADCKELLKVDFHECTIPWVRKGSFKNCYKLEEAFLPHSIHIVAPFSFENCISLQNIVFGMHLDKIKEKAFHNCSSIKTIQFIDYLRDGCIPRFDYPFEIPKDKRIVFISSFDQLEYIKKYFPDNEVKFVRDIEK